MPAKIKKSSSGPHKKTDSVLALVEELNSLRRTVENQQKKIEIAYSHIRNHEARIQSLEESKSLLLETAKRNHIRIGPPLAQHGSQIPTSHIPKEEQKKIEPGTNREEEG